MDVNSAHSNMNDAWQLEDIKIRRHLKSNNIELSLINGLDEAQLKWL